MFLLPVHPGSGGDRHSCFLDLLEGYCRNDPKTIVCAATGTPLPHGVARPTRDNLGALSSIVPKPVVVVSHLAARLQYLSYGAFLIASTREVRLYASLPT